VVAKSLAVLRISTTAEVLISEQVEETASNSQMLTQYDIGCFLESLFWTKDMTSRDHACGGSVK